MIDVFMVSDSRYSGNMVIMLRSAVITVYIGSIHPVKTSAFKTQTASGNIRKPPDFAKN
ncbi:hypothetical protein [Pedobacter psychrotolerans]|uniref:hypothetical protein n=1 Tax=Pedobacter psychrotolerans TaxID=1843235 RepID=UPI003F985976